ncbi:hypothetical protein HB780_05505 (plasmid) [Rhizobium lusitanum]|uniref:hypothetical protein n=1 Tax=Rhizobium lusitanum TaxID=293958 RepID=UPI001613B9C1|nr:hypothetical protein [Rhizobium lusitanum]QND45212.1 hypothetical protein HB780_05505 [Rhizobium lusitanum]
MKPIELKIDRDVRISANRNDTNFWRLFFDKPPVIRLDGEIIEQVYEARSGDLGFVTYYLNDEAGKPLLADVVLRSGEIIDTIHARKTMHGTVTITSTEAKG